MNMKITERISKPIIKIVTNQKVAEFSKTTACAIAVETTLKALGRPTFIYFDKNANKRSKKYAATKEFLYQSFSLALYLSLIVKFKKIAYKILSKKFAKNSAEDKRKLDLYDNFQKKIKAAKNKETKKNLEAKLTTLINTNKDYHFGKGVRELGAMLATVFILAICAPFSSQIILHPVLDLIFPKNKKTANKSKN